MATQSPEYKAIRLNRQSLEKYQATFLTEIADKLRDLDYLTDRQHQAILQSVNGSADLVGAILQSMEISPVETFLDFIYVLKKFGNKHFKKYIEDTIEVERNNGYRSLLEHRSAGVSRLFYDVFISYDHEAGTNDVVDKIAIRLKSEGLEVFVGKSNIKFGDYWPAETVDVMASCKAVVAVLTKKYVRSLYCWGELYKADALTKPLFPIFSEAGWDEDPASASVKKVIEKTQCTQGVEISDKFVENLLDKCGKALKKRLVTAEVIAKSIKVHSLHPQSKIQWERRADMPVKASNLQAVVIDDEVYIGGGRTKMDDLKAVCRYDSARDEWVRLAAHCVALFGLCQFQGNLVSVGGWSDSGATNKVYRYNKADRKWLECINSMPTARADLSVLTTASAIIACGGAIAGENGLVAVATVEVYSSHISLWCTADPLPQPCCAMSTVTISGSGILLGGANTDRVPIRSPFLVDMALLVDSATTPSQHPNITSAAAWKTLPDSTPLVRSTAATMSGNLLAVGGRDDKDIVQPAVYMFTPFSNTWMKLPSGDLPAKRYLSTTVQLSNNRVLVMGGLDKSTKNTSTCFIGSVVV